MQLCFVWVRLCSGLCARHERDADDLILRAILEVRSGADDDWKEKKAVCRTFSNSTWNSTWTSFAFRWCPWWIVVIQCFAVSYSHWCIFCSHFLFIPNQPSTITTVTSRNEWVYPYINQCSEDFCTPGDPYFLNLNELVENWEVSFDANALELLEEVKQAKEAFRQRSQLSTLYSFNLRSLPVLIISLHYHHDEHRLPCSTFMHFFWFPSFVPMAQYFLHLSTSSTTSMLICRSRRQNVFRSKPSFLSLLQEPWTCLPLGNAGCSWSAKLSMSCVP